MGQRPSPGGRTRAAERREEREQERLLTGSGTAAGTEAGGRTPCKARMHACPRHADWIRSLPAGQHTGGGRDQGRQRRGANPEHSQRSKGAWP